MATERRVAVTGLGVVSSLGSEVATFWRRCLAGETVVAPIPAAWRRYYPQRSSCWAPLGDWERQTPFLTRIEQKQLDPTGRMAVLAAEEALAGAGLEAALADRKRNRYRLAAYPPERCGVFMGTGIGGIHSTLESFSITAMEGVKKRLDAVRTEVAETREAVAAELAEVATLLQAPPLFNTFAVAMAMPNAVAANLSIKLSLTGPSRTFAAACASGTVALGGAAAAIRDGSCDLALAGGSEYLYDRYGACFRGFDAVGALAAGDLPPERINRPFDEERSGFLFSEGGAAVLVLEERAAAAARGAPVLAELSGYGESCDAYSTMVMAPDGRQVARALELCLADAGLDPADVDYVNAHGTGTAANDPLECRALGELLGRQVRVNSSKSLLGHTLGASGALEAVVAVKSLVEGRTHPTRNLERPIADLAFVTAAEPFPIRHALSQSFAFGGQNAVVAFSRP